jgi:hypothetical protein
MSKAFRWISACLVFWAFGAAEAAASANGSGTSASAVRREAVEALRRIEAGDEPSSPLSGRARAFAQALAAARTELEQGSELGRFRLLGWFQGDSATFIAAYKKYLRTGSKPDLEAAAGAMTGAEWARLALKRPLMTDPPPHPAAGRPLTETLTLSQIPDEPLEAVLWALSESDARAGKVGSDEARAALDAALAVRLGRGGAKPSGMLYPG